MRWFTWFSLSLLLALPAQGCECLPGETPAHLVHAYRMLALSLSVTPLVLGFFLFRFVRDLCPLEHSEPAPDSSSRQLP